MKVKAQLKMALDFGRARAKKGEPARHEKYSYQQDGKWYVVHCGPTYSNTYEVTEYDEEALARLKQMEVKEDKAPAQGPKPEGSVQP